MHFRGFQKIESYHAHTIGQSAPIHQCALFEPPRTRRFSAAHPLTTPLGQAEYDRVGPWAVWWRWRRLQASFGASSERSTHVWQWLAHNWSPGFGAVAADGRKGRLTGDCQQAARLSLRLVQTDKSIAQALQDFGIIHLFLVLHVLMPQT